MSKTKTPLRINIKDIVNMLTGANFVYVIGNGGSASLADHFGCDLVKVGGIKAVSLAANNAVITAYANDNGYENVFVDQLRVFLTSKDLLITISGSGTSKNIVKTIEYAVNIGAKVYSFPTMEELGCGIREAEDEHLQLAHKIVTMLKVE